MKKLNSKSALILLIILTTITTIVLLLVDILFKFSNDSKMILIILLLISLLFALLFSGILLFLTYKTRIKSVESLVDSINSIESFQEESLKVGTIVFDEEKRILFISPWMQRAGFHSFLGKQITKLKINADSDKEQKIELFSHFWKVNVCPKNKTILFKDVTSEAVLEEIIRLGQNAILTFHVSFSKKISINEHLKSEAHLKIFQVIQEYTNKVGGIFESMTSAENISRSIVKWELIKKDIHSEYLLDIIKQSLGKLSKEVTVSIGASFGGDDFMSLSVKSLKSLEIAKNRGGDQIVIETHNGETTYVGNSSIQATSLTVLNIKKFYNEFIKDIKKARRVFITSHYFADLDAISSSLGLYELLKTINTDIFIILDTFDTSAQNFKNSLPSNLKKLFITEKEALRLLTNRTYVVLTDTSNVNSSQAPNIIKKTSPENISVIDHHRFGQQEYVFLNSKLLIETSISSASEIVVEMMKLSNAQDSYNLLTAKIATGLLSGIRMDTKELTKNVSDSTFEAVSFLMKNDASIKEVQDLLKIPQNFMKIEAAGLKNITKINKDIIFTFFPENIVVSEEFTSIFADKLLKYEGIEASFVLAKIKNNRFKVSMRSNEKINVQLIAELVGGGGHFNVAAASWASNIKYNTVKKRIINAIQKGTK